MEGFCLISLYQREPAVCSSSLTLSHSLSLSPSLSPPPGHRAQESHSSAKGSVPRTKALESSASAHSLKASQPLTRRRRRRRGGIPQHALLPPHHTPHLTPHSTSPGAPHSAGSPLTRPWAGAMLLPQTLREPHSGDSHTPAATRHCPKSTAGPLDCSPRTCLQAGHCFPPHNDGG